MYYILYIIYYILLIYYIIYYYIIIRLKESNNLRLLPGKGYHCSSRGSGTTCNPAECIRRSKAGRSISEVTTSCQEGCESSSNNVGGSIAISGDEHGVRRLVSCGVSGSNGGWFAAAMAAAA